jgi:hypothetical protein
MNRTATTAEEAAAWVARRLQEGTPTQQIIGELKQDGMHEAEAKAIFTAMEREVARQVRPGLKRMALFLAETLLPATALAFLWASRDPLGEVEAPIVKQACIAGAYGLGVGVALAGVVAVVVGGRRGFRVLLLAWVASAYAIVLGSSMAAHDAPGRVTAVGYFVAVVASAFLLTRGKKPYFEPVEGQDGRYAWRRAQRPAYALPTPRFAPYERYSADLGERPSALPSLNVYPPTFGDDR